MNEKIDVVINVDTSQVDGATNKIKTLRTTADASMASMGKSSKKAAKDMKDFGKETASTTEDVKKLNKETKETGKGVMAVGDSFSNLLKKSKDAFTGVGQGFKGMGVAAKSFGKTLLANPLFILVILIKPIIDIFMRLVEELGIVEAYFKLIDIVVKALTDSIFFLTDALGITNKQAEKFHAEQTKRAEEAANIAKTTSKIIIDEKQGELDLLKAQGASIEEIEAKELELAVTTHKATTERIEAEKLVIKQQMLSAELAGENIDELKNKLIELEGERRKADTALEIFEAQQETNRENRRKQEEQDSKDSIKRTQDEAKAKREARAKEEEARKVQEEKDAKERADIELKVTRQLEDMKANLIEDEIEREAEKLRLKYERLIEDTLNNEKLSKDQKDALIESFRLEEEAKEKEIEDKAEKKRIEKEEKEIADEKLKQEKLAEAKRELDDLLLDLRGDDMARALRDLDDHYDATLDKLKESLEAGLITKEEYDELEIEAEKEKLEKIKELNDAAAEADRVQALDNMLAKVDIAKQYASAVNDLAGAIFQISDSYGKQDEESKERRAKKQFAVQKALNLSMAAIDGAAAITSSLKQAPLAIGVIPNPAGIASLAAAITSTATTLATIAAAKFSSSKSSGGGSSVSTPSTVSAPAQTNTVTMFKTQDNGTTNPTRTVQNDVADTSTSEQTIKAVVSWTDIDAVSNMENNVQNQMQL